LKRIFRILPHLFLIGLMTFSNCDDDTEVRPQISFLSGISSVKEGESLTVSFTLSLPAGVSPILSLGGTASLNTDYTYSVTPAGLVFTAMDDGIQDPDETIIITLKEFEGNAQLGPNKVHTITIEEPPVIAEFKSASSLASEGGNVTVEFNKPLPAGIAPEFELTGTANEVDDYTYTITQSGIVFTLKSDGVYDPDETIIVTLTGATGNAELGTNIIHTLTITEPAIVVEFESVLSTRPEGSDFLLAFENELPDGIAAVVSFDGTATEGDDFTYSVTPQGVHVALIDDGIYDPDETVSVTITAATGNAVLGDAVTHLINILESPLVVEFVSTASVVAEGGKVNVLFNIELPDEVTPILELTGTAIHDVDYTYTVAPDGLIFTILSDAINDPDETFVITLTGINGNAILGAQTTHTVTITDTPIIVEFAAALSVVNEGQGVTVSFSQVLPAGITPIISLGGTAATGSDYTYTQSSGGLIFTIVNDGQFEPDETVIITLTAVSGNANLGSVVVHTLTIMEPALVVEFESPSSTGGEGGLMIVPFNVTLPAGITPSVSWGGSATQGSDYAYVINSSSIEITLLEDGLYDPNETIVLTLTSISGNAVLGGIRTHTVVVTEPPLVIEFATGSSTLTEGQEALIPFNVVLPDGVTPSVTVGGTAMAGVDFTLQIGEEGVKITATNDGLYEPDETIIITLTGISGNTTLGDERIHTVTLVDIPLIVEFDSETSESSEGLNVKIGFTQDLPGAVVPAISLGGTATSSSDYTYSIAADGIDITLLDDGVYDPGETIIITLTGVSGNAQLGTQLTHTITVNEPELVVEFQSASSAIDEGDQHSVSFNMSLPAGVSPTIVLSGTATEGDDFTFSVTPEGLTFAMLDDGQYDPNETIIITLQAVSGNAILGSTTTHTITINEPALVVEFQSASSMAAEGDVIQVLFNMSLPAGVSPTLALGGTAIQGEDYTYVVGSDGIEIIIAADGLYDPGETITLNLTGVSGNAVLGAVVSHTITVTEPPLVVEFSTGASSGKEGESRLVPFNISLPVGVTPSFSLGGTAIEGVDYTYVIVATGIIFTLVYDEQYDPDETITITLTGISGNAVLGGSVMHTLTISELPLEVEFQTSASTVPEGGTVAVLFNLTLPAGVTPSISFGGTAMQGVDYTYSINPSGIVITATDDGIFEPDETILIDITGVTGNAELGSAIAHTVTVTEPALVVEFASASSSISEGGSIGIPFNVTLPDDVTPTLLFNGTAAQNIDYTFTTDGTGIVITSIADGLYDPSETIIITLAGITGNAELGIVVMHTVTITEPVLVVEFASTSSSVSEGAATQLPFNMVLPAGVTPEISLGGTATLGADYSYSLNSEGIQISPIDDGLYDPDETIIITLTGISGNTELGTTTIHTVTITEAPLVVEFSAGASSVEEGSGHSVLFNMTLPGDVTPTLSFGGTATHGEDYTYAVNATGILLTTSADGLYDPNETIILTLTGISGNAVLGTTTTHTITLTEPQLVVEFELTTSSVSEGQGIAVPFNVPLPAGVTPTVSIGGTTTEGIDYTYVISPEGIVITTEADELHDPDETIIITLTGISGNAVLGTLIVHTVTITESPLIVEFQSASSSIQEGSIGSVAFNLLLPGEVIPNISFGGTATEGVDYTYSVTATGIELIVPDDDLFEMDETIVLTLTGITGNAELGTTISHTVTIIEPSFIAEFESSDSSVPEGSATMVPFSANLPEGITPTFTISGTALSGVDYTYSVTSGGIMITTSADAIYETNETIVITLTGITGNAELGAVTVHTVTIIEPPFVVRFATSSSLVTEGENRVLPFSSTLPDGISPTVTFGGTATEGLDYSYNLTPGGVEISTFEDWTADPDETIIMTLVSVTGNAVLGNPESHTLSITDPPAQVIEFNSGSSTVSEGENSTVLFTVPLPAGVVPAITFGGTATPLADYNYSLTATGVELSIHVDGLADVDETIVLTITGFNNSEVELGTTLTHTITVTDIPAVVEFTSASSIVQEGQDYLIAFITPLPDGIIPIVVFGGSATQGDDFTYEIQSDGIHVSVLEDWINDDDETIVATLTGASGNAIIGSVAIHTLTVDDPVGQVFDFEYSSSNVVEGQEIIVSFNAPLPDGVTPIISLEGTATQGIDYTYSIVDGSLVITALNDGTLDPDETVIITLTGFTSTDIELGANTVHTVTIGDEPLLLEFSETSSSLLEGEQLLVTFNTLLPAGVMPTISLAGSATLTTDFTYTIASEGIIVTASDEWSYDPDETIIITLTGTSGNAELGSQLVHTVTILDTPVPAIEFSSNTSVVVEGQNITIDFNTPLPDGVTPTITLGGTASHVLDYVYSFVPGGIVIYTIGDGLIDVNETVIITLTGFNTPNTAELGTNVTHTVTITDTPLVVDFVSSGVRRIEGTSAIAAFSHPLPEGVTPIFTVGGTATQGSDFTLVQGSNSFVLTALKDEIFDPEETAIIQLTGFTGNVVLGPNTTYTLTIGDEDESSSARIQIDLTWDAGNGTPGDVDMDLILWYETPAGSGSYRFEILSDNIGTTFESLSIPAVIQDGKYGLSFVYYGGTSDNVTFTVNFRSYKGNINGTSNRATYVGNYTLANVNPWDQTQNFQIEQYYNKVGTNYINLTDIFTPEAGSRTRQLDFVVDEVTLKQKSQKMQSRPAGQ
jgi:invasion protein IalB